MAMATPPLIYNFQPDERLDREFVRLLRAISARARGLARRSHKPVGESVHETRLLIKRLRALLWFARPALGRAAYARARTQLRKAAELLSGQRDLAVTQSTLNDLSRKTHKRGHRTALAHVLRNPVFDASAGKAQEKSFRSALEKAVEILRRSVHQIQRVVPSISTWPSPSKRLRKAFRAMFRAGEKARQTGKDTDFHTWRKKAKRLHYQLELTQANRGGRTSEILKKAEKLQNKLGLYHDCVVVENHLRKLLPLAAPERRVAALLMKRKTHLRKQACKIAQQLKIKSYPG